MSSSLYISTSSVTQVVQVPVTADQVADEILLVKSVSGVPNATTNPVLMKSISGGQATQVLTVAVMVQSNHDPASSVGRVAVKR